MAKWNMNYGGLKGGIEYDSGARVGESFFRFEQDEKPFLEQAKRDREKGLLKTENNMRKFATIPEIVAIEIKNKYGVDLHGDGFMHDIDAKAKFFQIVRQDYPHLVVNKD